MKRIVFTRPDGSVGIIVPAPGGRLVQSVRRRGQPVALPEPVPLSHMAASCKRRDEIEILAGEDDATWLQRIAEKDVPAGCQAVTICDETDLPADRTHRDAWVWDGSRVVVDETRIKPKPVAEPVREGSVPVHDPRLDQIGPELAQQMAAAFEAMRRELRAEIAIEHQRSIEALTVHSALADGREIAPGSFPALERMIADGGQPVTADAIVAAADEQARRGIQLAEGAA